MYFSDSYIIFILLSAIASLLVFFNKNKTPLFWYFFPLLLFAAFVVEYVAINMAYRGENNTAIYDVFTTFEYIFYFWMFSYFIYNTVLKKILYNLLWLYPMLVLINKSFIQKGEQFHTLTSGMGSILIVLCAVYYFYELFRAKKTVDLIREPAFWIASGLLFFYSCTFPLFVFIFSLENSAYTLIHYIVILVSVANILLYSSFIIAFLCRIRFKKFFFSAKWSFSEFILVGLWYQNIYCSVKKYWQGRFVKRKLAKLRIFARLFI